MSEQPGQPGPEEQVREFEREATAAKRSHGEADEFVVDTEVDEGAPHEGGADSA